MIDLKALADAAGYRIALDPAADLDGSRESKLWCQRIPCARGFISVHGATTLAAYTDRPKMIAKLAAIPGVLVHQRGDAEARVLFGPDRLADVAELLQARKRRQVSEATRERLKELSQQHSPFLRRERPGAVPCDPLATPR